MKKNTTKQIDYYGDTDNYIHLKFGDARKMYNFTKEFMEEYQDFSRQYQLYWDNNTESRFKNALDIINFIEEYEIPVHLYFNYTDTPATMREAREWYEENNKPDTTNQPLF